jgi:pimeloyl-ACP methyl ester carboxylesterase
MQTSRGADGVEIAYTDQGAGDPLVLVHGFTGAGIDWTDVVPALAAGHRVITMDHRGHGHSTNTGDASSYTLDRLAADLAGLVDDLGLGAFHLLGHSMGGAVVLRYLLDHQATGSRERVRSLILMDTAAEAMDIPAEFLEAGIALVERGGMMAVFEAGEQFALLDTEHRRVIHERGRVKHSQMDPVAFVALARQLTTAASMMDRLPSVAVPTTVLVGENDVPFRGSSARMAAAIPGARLVVQAGAGHCPQEDDAEQWLRTVEDHLAWAR